MASTEALRLHKDAVVIDGVCPLLVDKSYLEWYQEGGLTAVTPTVGGWRPAVETIKHLAGWLYFIDQRDDLVLVRRAADIEAAKHDGKTGIILHFQGTEPVEDDLNLVAFYKAVGVGMIQLAYNVKNRVGDGAQERTDCGLSYFGLELIKRCNEAKVIVDCSHTGARTALDAIEASDAPVVFSHANAKRVHPSPRNITDEQIKGVAATGGLVGAVGFPGFVADASRPDLDQFIAHIDHVADLVGVEHTALGIDYYTGQHPVADPKEAQRYYDHSIACGRWRSDAYPPPPHHFPQGIETPRTLPALTERLVERGYADADIRKILGENWLRVFRSVWGE